MGRHDDQERPDRESDEEREYQYQRHVRAPNSQSDLEQPAGTWCLDDVGRHRVAPVTAGRDPAIKSPKSSRLVVGATTSWIIPS